MTYKLIILPNLSKVLCISKFCLRYSYVILILIPLIFALYFLIKKNFIKFAEMAEQKNYNLSKKRQRMVFFVLRSIIFSLVIFAISSPFILEQKIVKGNPRVTILVDNSSSLELFESGVGNELASKLKGKIPVNLRSIGSGEKSAIGDGILNYIDRNENVLVITDGNNNHGKFLGDIMLLAASLNATVSTVNLEDKKSDVGVWIEGPSEAIKDSEENFAIRVSNIGENIPYRLEVRLDNEVVLSQSDDESRGFRITKEFSEGYHKIEAELFDVGNADHFPKNNIYYKSVKVLKRPKVLFVSEKSSLFLKDLEEIYDIVSLSSIPNDLSPFLAIVLNDIHLNKIEPHYEKIEKFVSDGNGLLVVGGEKSFERGNYKSQGALFPQLLPVKIGTGESSEESDVNIVVALDVSGTTTVVYDTAGRPHYRDLDRVIKALGVSILGSLDESSNVGAVAIGTKQSPFVGKIQDILPLADNIKDIIDKFSRLASGGQSAIEGGIKLSRKMLEDRGGGKNIILISDGRGLNPVPQIAVLEAVRDANARGIKIYVVGVGAVDRQEQEFLEKIARFGEGIYWPADASNRLKILFDDPEGKDKEFLNSLTILDNTHFITFNISLDAIVSGYNFVLPKPAARTLVSTNKNVPILVTWRFGLGRIAVLATDDGGKWAGELLRKQNSELLTKTINWNIGNLGRKKNFDVTIKDTTLSRGTVVNVISNSLPEHKGLSFVKSDVNLYSSVFNPTKTGFHNILGAEVAVNYNAEYKDLGINNEFLSLVEQTGGKVFEKDDVEGIIEFLKEKSKRIKVNATELKWPFVLIALILFLFEVYLRRVWENKSYMG